jgi:Flp pilus assembly protein TadD
MIFLIPLRDLKLFTAADLDNLSETEIVAAIRAEHPTLFTGARISVADDVVAIEFPEPAPTSRSEAARLLEKGVQRCQQGEYQKAAGILERVLELDSANVPAYRNLGMALMELGQTEKAQQYLVEAALLDPTDAWPYVVLGNALVRKPGQRDAAARLLGKAHELNPNDPWAMNSLGGIETERGDLAAAKDWFERALAAKPDFANAHYGLASALASQGHFDKARARLGILFSEGEMQDVRSAAVFDAARDLWREIAQQLANTHREASLAAVRGYLTTVSAKSGFPVKEEWADFPENFAAQTQMAWKKGRDHHLIRLRKGYPDPAWHHILAHEATHIAMESEARAAGRNRWFVTTAETRSKALKSMEPDIRKIGRQRPQDDRLAELMVQLHNGATAFVFNCAADMVIEARLQRELPVLADAQLISLDQLAREAMSVTSHREIRKVTPERIQSVNDTLNAAMALFLRDFSNGALNYVGAYKPFHCLPKAERLYAAYQAAAAKGFAPGQEYDLIDEFAAQLGVRGWYVWQPDTGAMGDPVNSADAAQAPSSPAKTINSPAAMMFLVAALDRLDGRSDENIRQIATEAALKGTTGLDLDSTEKVHAISAFGNERFSGLELLCLMHVAFQKINPGTTVGVDFSEIWPAAQMMHAARKR